MSKDVLYCGQALPGAAVGPRTEGTFPPSDLLRGGLPMVTFSDLFQFGILIVGICGLFIQAAKK